MSAEGQLDPEAWERLLEWHVAAGTSAVVVSGTTGESPTLSGAEYAELLSSAVEHVSGRIPVIAGTGSADTAATVEKTRLAASLGADAALVVTPYYNRPPQRGLVRHFLAVAESTALPIVLYNVPGRTGVDLLPESAAELAEHERIVGLKEAVGDEDRIRALVESCAGRIDILSGDDPTAARGMELGLGGVISVAANVAPGPFARMCAAAAEGDFDEAGRIDRELRPLYEFLGAESNPIPAKWLLWRMGRIGSGIRLPLVPLSPEHHSTGERIIGQLNLN